MLAYRIMLGIDLLAAAGVVFFFLWGVQDGSVSDFNIALWLALLLGVGGIVGGGVLLRRRGSTGAACLVLALLAVPATLAALFMLLLILGAGGRWN
jgi:hypothetical protein